MACQNCSAGDDCGCSDYGKEADGNGGCRCPGMKIDDGKGGCRCPDDYESDGTWGGCKLIDPCMNVSCPDAQKCVEGDCVNCPLGEDCGCFEDDAFSNGDGICEPNVHECDPGKAYNTETRACEDCAENDDCGCFEEGGYADGKGGCKIICKDWEYWDGSQCVPAVGACNTSDDCVRGNYCLDHSCRPGCEKDDDCKKGSSGAYCQNNTCVEGCRNDDDCSSGKFCYSGVCKEVCDSFASNPCTNPKYPNCSSNTLYKDKYSCRCTSTSCGDGYECTYSLSEIVHNTPNPNLCKPIGDGSCTKDTDCDSLENCYDGICKSPCDFNPCTDPQYPTCSDYHQYSWDNARNAGYICKCTSSSCGSGYKCETTYSGASYVKDSPDSGLCKVLQTESCTTDENCSAEKKCRDGYCIFRDVCAKDADCASNERCSENGYCVIK